ncbi:hypothetical protein [Burkholderia cenocepacia]|uniref:hypothetical protein n=1 Tax=Burkholderia cenocepacia TaxID=95486 RepID=UPI0028BCD7A5|nr:hypothetical protein [Burkholderia cenocepacia]MDT6997630.1 hypothetical protein [Burkholderia cenocepacia]
MSAIDLRSTSIRHTSEFNSLCELISEHRSGRAQRAPSSRLKILVDEVNGQSTQQARTNASVPTVWMMSAGLETIVCMARTPFVHPKDEKNFH